jgi:hypothetical protein
MTIKEDLTQAMKDAMKARDNTKKTTVRMVLAAVKNAELNQGSALEDADVLGIIQKEIKNRQDAIEEAKTANRDDLIEESTAEIAVLQVFLPPAIGEDELAEMVDAAIAEVGASSMRDMGKVMQILMPQTKGRADGKQISGMVRQKLMSG